MVHFVPMDDRERAVLDLAAEQHGAFSRHQARALGCTDRVITRRVATGRWSAAAPGVLVLPGRRATWRRALWVAHLHAGPSSVVSHESAARLHGSTQVRRGVVAVTVEGRRRHGIPGVVWHRPTDLVPAEVVRIDGLPVTSPARTVVDLAAVVSAPRLRLVVEAGVLDRSLTLAEVGAILSRVRRRGKPGVSRLAAVLDDLGPGDGIPHSELERLLDRVIELAGLPPPLREHPLPGAGPRSGFVDRYWPDARLVVEADGRRWHARHQQMKADADRDLLAHAAGAATNRLLWEHLHHDPDGTAVLLRAVHDRRIELLWGNS
jgi:hypothetical protein